MISYDHLHYYWLKNFIHSIFLHNAILNLYRIHEYLIYSILKTKLRRLNTVDMHLHTAFNPRRIDIFVFKSLVRKYQNYSPLR